MDESEKKFKHTSSKHDSTADRFRLASTLHKADGAYVLLLGSGISRGAHIPTGWDVKLDLIKKLAYAQDRLEPVDPEKWYQEKFGCEPDYGDLLEQLAEKPADRMNLLNSYFEPTPEQLEHGIKTPSKAHRAVAKLVRDGYIKILITTNFDRLLEQSISDEGIHPTVISTADQLRSAVPLQHLQCVILKVNGDYRDPRIRNTKEELVDYGSQWTKCLKRIASEYGLIICGWSAEYDTALHEILVKHKSNQYSTYYTLRDQLKPEALALVKARRGTTIKITDADEFCLNLNEDVEAMDAYEQKQQPTSIDVAVERAKKYLSEPKYDITLHDYVFAEVSKIKTQFPTVVTPLQPSEKSFQICEELVKTLCAMLSVGCYWEQWPHKMTWRKSLEQVMPPQGLDTYMECYPAIVCLYAGGIASLCRLNWEALSCLLNDAKHNDSTAAERTLSAVLGEMFAALQDNADSQSAMSKGISNFLRPLFLKYLQVDSAEFDANFDYFEYIFNLHCASLSQTGNFRYCPVGKYYTDKDRLNKVRMLLEEEEKKGANMPLVQHGLFLGLFQTLQATRQNFNTWLSNQGPDKRVGRSTMPNPQLPTRA